MLIDFRQGLVRAPANFLMKNGSAVSLQVPPNDTVIAAIADGTADYLISEKQSIVNAWAGPFAAGTDYWLYWDIHLVTGVRSFGHTKLEPFEGPTPPSTPQADQHWFDTSTKMMKVYNATTNRWTRVIRVFACHYSQGGVLIGMGANSGFTGTQAGLTGQTNAGALLFDNLGGVLKKKDGTYFTSEDYALTGIAQSSQVKFGSMQIRAEAGIYMPALTLVQFVDYNRVVPASIHVIDKVNYGVIEFDANVGDVVNVTVDGVIRSGTWDFPAMGVPMNAPIYIDANGALTPNPSAPPVPIGTVIDKDAILLRPSSLFMGDNAAEPGPQGEIGYTGSAGAAGVDGPMGPQGYTGSAGVDGAAGPQGPQGERGETGYTGSRGEDGAMGVDGAMGPRGYTGSAGEDGVQGPVGYTGSRGADGTSITIKGALASVEELPVLNNTPGDCYVIDGNLYVWGGESWSNAGAVQGPIGYTGSQGPQGIQGNIGYTGSAGAAGPAGAAGGVGYTGSQGDVGFTGSAGPAGPAGATGSIGFTGSAGIQGNIGYTGSQGIPGATGPAGAGYTGSQGATGFTGSAGAQGIQGNIGYTGSASTVAGPAGATGFTGSQGFTGSAGPAGATGFTGSASTVAGPAGATGFTGSMGYTGSAGPAGATGFTGSMGYTGSAGPAGATGFTGSASTVAGPAGATGFTGSMGYTGSASTVAGPAGATGFTGSMGYTGSAGTTGFTGSASTVAGPAGFTGSIGYTGSAGSAGATGFTGSQGIQGFTGSSGTTNFAVQDEGTVVRNAPTFLNFTGAGVTATSSTDGVIVNIPGGGGGSALAVLDEGTSLTTGATSINFTGAGVTATNSGGDVTVNVPGGGGSGGSSLVTRVITISPSSRVVISAVGAQADLDAVTATASQTSVVNDTMTIGNVPVSLKLQSFTYSYDANYTSATTVYMKYPEQTGATSTSTMMIPVMIRGTFTGGVIGASVTSLQIPSLSGGIVTITSSSVATNGAVYHRVVIL